MLRKALVSDVVHGFCYDCRHRDANRQQTTSVIFEYTTGPAKLEGKDIPSYALVPFVAYAFAHESNYILVTRQVIRIAVWLHSFSNEEYDYAIYLMNKYYHGHTSIREVSLTESESVFCGYDRQKL